MPRKVAVRKLPPGSKSGLILICDIVDFSHLSRQEQKAAVERLWNFINHDRWEDLLGVDRIINGTGDGFMIACPDHAQEVQHRDFIDFADAMVRHMARARPRRIGLRIGIHQGAFTWLDLKFKLHELGECRARQGIGKGINRCARIVAIGDDGDITVSEKFIEEWADTDEERVRRNFSPRPPKDAFEVTVKHGETLELRFFRPGGRVNRPWPKKMEAVRAAQKQLRVQLQLILNGFCYYVALLDPTLKVRNLDVRVSLFAEGLLDDERLLLPTKFRHHQRDHGIQEGATCYSVTGAGAGPAGRAYVGHQIEIWPHLPDPKKAGRDYIRALSKTGLDRATIRGFYRKARAFIAFPFGMQPSRPDGVVCIDTMHPLLGLTNPQIRDIARFLQRHFAVTLSALWRLRGQL